jgi:hypothetical protein
MLRTKKRKKQRRARARFLQFGGCLAVLFVPVLMLHWRVCGLAAVSAEQSAPTRLGADAKTPVAQAGALLAVSQRKIPKVLHQIWISRHGNSDNPLPDFCKRESARIKAMHEAEGWEYHLWGDELWEMYKTDSIVSTYKKNAFDQKTVAFITDRFRLLLLRDRGGVFCDVDAHAVRTFTHILEGVPPDTTFFSSIRSLEKDPLPESIIEVAAMGSAPRSRVILAALAHYTPPSKTGQLTIPHGGRIGRWFASDLDEHSVILNWHLFYDNVLTDQTVLLQNGFELGSWRSDNWRTTWESTGPARLKMALRQRQKWKAR